MKYKFIAEFQDGSFIEQTDDISSIDPTRSQFYDVINSASPLERFTVVHTETGVEYGVNLSTLNFNSDGHEFRLHTNEDLPLTDIEVVYWRNMAVDILLGETITNSEPRFVSLRLGWKGKKGDVEITKFIEID